MIGKSHNESQLHNRQVVVVLLFKGGIVVEIKYTYTKINSYDFERGEEFGDSEEFVYELTDDQIVDGLYFIFTNKNQTNEFRNGIKFLLETFSYDGVISKIAENYYEELKEYYEDDAKDWFLGE